ncbi:HD domain-containing protein [uncultured Bifidobacterium sp.]|uniref:HD domain-containing protein n=1 Tax=uncultured Bifidobacterium sp. TaxID=165187 RepID=UPI00262B5AA4|nr:HD domain-containing protein [uncultured Bifidobacterium sp.]
MTGLIPNMQQIDDLHRRISPSEAAYDLIHTHCVIVATIARALARRQNALFMRRCTLPVDSSERGGDSHGGCDPSTSSSEGFMVPPTEGVVGGTIPPHYLDERMVVVGGLLHDIGTYRVLAHDGSDGRALKFDGPRYILHGLLGYEYLKEQGVDESIAEFARNHTGVGLTREQVVEQNLPLPPDNYSPMTLEQEVVMVADKYHSKSIPPRFLTAEAYERKAARYGEANRRAWMELVRKYGVPDIDSLARQYDMPVSR